MENIKLTAHLISPIVGDVAKLDSLLEYQLSFLINSGSHKAGYKINKWTPKNELQKIPIPLESEIIKGIKIYKCSDPILLNQRAEWVEKFSKRFDTSEMALMLHEKSRISLPIASGHYKSLFKPIHIKLVESVVYFCRGNKKEILRLAKKTDSIGDYRKFGYGIIEKWDAEIIENDYSIHADNVLMRTIPYSPEIAEKINGAVRGFGACTSPYWHPQNYCEVLKPC